MTRKVHMKTASVTEAKSRLSALLDRVRSGESVLILDRGNPVARLEPVPGDTAGGGRVARLEKAGVLKRRRGGIPLEELRQPGPALPPGVSAVDALLEERRSGR